MYAPSVNLKHSTSSTDCPGKSELTAASRQTTPWCGGNKTKALYYTSHYRTSFGFSYFLSAAFTFKFSSSSVVIIIIFVIIHFLVAAVRTLPLLAAEVNKTFPETLSSRINSESWTVTACLRLSLMFKSRPGLWDVGGGVAVVGRKEPISKF